MDVRLAPLIAIEHLEPSLSEWSFIEYAHAAKIARKENLVVTNVKDLRSRRKLFKLCRVERKSVLELFSHSRLLILDPKARKPLSFRDFRSDCIVVIGGILGDDPPRGRTAELLSSRAPKVKKRNLGPKQFSTDGSVFVIREIAGGRNLNQVKTVSELEIPVSSLSSVVLPFAYPISGGKPVVSKELVRYLKTKGFRF